MLCKELSCLAVCYFCCFLLYQVLDMNFIEANKELTAIAPLVPEKFKALDIKDGLQCPSQVLHNGIRW